jgi:hypothetical protein
MIQIVERLLKRLGLVRPFTDDEVINAEIEDKAREHETLIGRLDLAFMRRSVSNAHLRESLRIAKRRTNSFAEFEKHFVGRED